MPGILIQAMSICHQRQDDFCVIPCRPHKGNLCCWAVSSHRAMTKGRLDCHLRELYMKSVLAYYHRAVANGTQVDWGETSVHLLGRMPSHDATQPLTFAAAGLGADELLVTPNEVDILILNHFIMRHSNQILCSSVAWPPLETLRIHGIGQLRVMWCYHLLMRCSMEYR